MADPTTNYGWDLPNVGGDIGSWGTVANTTFQSIDTEVKNRQNEAAAAQSTANTANTTANAALPKAGGVMTGRADLKTASMAIGTTPATSGAVAFDLTTGDFFAISTTGNVTFSFTNVPAGFVAIVLRTALGGAHSITWPASVKWPNATTPTPTPAGPGYDVWTLITDDSGTTWRAVRSMRDVH